MTHVFTESCKKAGSADHVAVLFGISSSWIRAQVAKEKRGLEPGSAELHFRLQKYLESGVVLPPLDELFEPRDRVVVCYRVAKELGLMP